MLGDDTSPEVRTPSLQPHKMHRDYVMGQQSDY